MGYSRQRRERLAGDVCWVRSFSVNLFWHMLGPELTGSFVPEAEVANNSLC